MAQVNKRLDDLEKAINPERDRLSYAVIDEDTWQLIEAGIMTLGDLGIYEAVKVYIDCSPDDWD